ncbi:MAG TPA: DUF3373 family protein, partial [Candidatus Polarisedimenticolia bacterium]|nr:DUF3373 family protein [Candidatus Polarisedimenticolia bacterium]
MRTSFAKWPAAMALGFVIGLVPAGALAGDEPDPGATDEGTEKRIEAVERKTAMDRISFTGEIRVATDTIDGTQAAFFNGMTLQRGIVDSLFYVQTNGVFPAPINPLDPQSIYQVLATNVGANYADYLYFLNGLTFDGLKATLATFTPAQQQALMGLLLPGTAQAQRDYRNDIAYTTRLRLNMKAEVDEHFSFSGRLAMYKIWGDSTGVQVFNGQPNSIDFDGTTTSVPNSDVVRVDRAYFDWKNIGGSNWYLSLGRRPSTGGPPLEIRENRLRGGTPLGHVVDFQFDGATFGYTFKKMPGAIYRFCYGLGFESGFGSADQLRAPADRLSDVHFGGLNLDLYASERMFLQATVLRAWHVTDGFNGLVVMPFDPVTGIPAPGPAVLRFTPSANLGNIDLGAILMERQDGAFHYFVSLAGMKSHAENITTPFGGLFSDPFEAPRDHSASSLYAGARWDLLKGKSQVGVEYNHGSKYWFNFTHAADDLVLSKLATRGEVWEIYYNQALGPKVQFRLSALDYRYEYSGSGWHLGAPKRLDDMPILGFPTYKD